MKRGRGVGGEGASHPLQLTPSPRTQGPPKKICTRTQSALADGTRTRLPLTSSAAAIRGNECEFDYEHEHEHESQFGSLRDPEPHNPPTRPPRNTGNGGIGVSQKKCSGWKARATISALINCEKKQLPIQLTSRPVKRWRNGFPDTPPAVPPASCPITPRDAITSHWNSPLAPLTFGSAEKVRRTESPSYKDVRLPFACLMIDK